MWRDSNPHLHFVACYPVTPLHLAGCAPQSYVCFDTDTTFVVFRPIRTRQCACELILHINQVLQSHLLKAGEFVPLSASTNCVEGEVRVEDVSDELTADVCKGLHR
jgi:hypothetical protein